MSKQSQPISKLSYDLIRQVIRTNQHSVRMRSRASEKLSHVRIAHLITNNPFRSRGNTIYSDLEVQPFSRTNIAVLKEFVMVSSSNTDGKDKSSITVNLQ